MIFKEVTKNADEDEHTAPELFRDVGGCDETSAAKIMTWVLEMKLLGNSKNATSAVSHIQQDFLNFFIKIITYWESSLDLIASYDLCALL